MKLLIVTQILDEHDPVLGFFHRWIEMLSSHEKVSSIEVVCLYEGEHHLPASVHVHSLGKESLQSRVRYLFRFYRYMWKLRKEYDAVFVHMIPLYVVLGAPVWRLLGKRIGFWYAHGTVSFMLRVAHVCSHHIITSTPEGFRIPSKKRAVVGQGIDTDLFAYTPKNLKEKQLRLVSVGRISNAKCLTGLVEACARLRERGIGATLAFIGAPITKNDQAYKKLVLETCKKHGVTDAVSFLGGVSYEALPKTLADFDMFVHAGNTGSLDKALLESLAVGLPTISSNDAYPDVVGAYRETLTYSPGDVGSLVERIEQVCMLSEKERRVMQDSLRKTVEREHSLRRLINAIVEQY